MDKELSKKNKENTSVAPFVFGKGTAKNFIGGAFSAIDRQMNLEVIHITKGSGKISCDFVDYIAKEGELFIVNADVFSGFSVPEDKDFEYTYLEIDRDFCKFNGIDVSKLRFNENVKDTAAVEKYQKITELYKLRNEYAEIALRSAVLDLLYTLCTCHVNKNPSVKKKKANVENIRLSVVYIRENLASKLSTAELARASGISEFYFIREFKRITNYTPVTYINYLRCDTARRMLYDSDKSVGEIAALCGFDNMPYFTKTFKKYIGILPSDIKREKKGLERK